MSNCSGLGSREKIIAYNEHVFTTLLSGDKEITSYFSMTSVLAGLGMRRQVMALPAVGVGP